MNVLILGGGAQGRVIAADLAAACPQAKLSVADVRKPALPQLPNLGWLEADLGDANAVVRLLASARSRGSVRCPRASASRRCAPRSRRSARWSTCRSPKKTRSDLDCGRAKGGHRAGAGLRARARALALAGRSRGEALRAAEGSHDSGRRRRDRCDSALRLRGHVVARGSRRRVHAAGADRARWQAGQRAGDERARARGDRGRRHDGALLQRRPANVASHAAGRSRTCAR